MPTKKQILQELVDELEAMDSKEVVDLYDDVMNDPQYNYKHIMNSCFSIGFDEQFVRISDDENRFELSKETSIRTTLILAA